MDNEILDTPDHFTASRGIPKYLRLIAMVRLILSFLLGALILISCRSIYDHIIQINAGAFELKDLIVFLILFPIGQLLYFVRQMVSEFLLRSNCYDSTWGRIFSICGGVYIIYLLLNLMFPPSRIKLIPDSFLVVFITMSVIVIIQDGIYLMHNWRERGDHP